MLAIDRRTPLLLAIAAATAMLALTGWQGYQFWQNETQRTLPQPTREASTGADQARTVPDVQLSDLEVFGSATATPQ
ncbi:MAG TPA: general secretion pathway protein GspC, partial [Marinobacter hydrocarbonoclasticus]|nr:general secretion pathway protein GspC [Marinobacter nauticus]